jgi:hypothetical protein
MGGWGLGIGIGMGMGSGYGGLWIRGVYGVRFMAGREADDMANSLIINKESPDALLGLGNLGAGLAGGGGGGGGEAEV